MFSFTVIVVDDTEINLKLACHVLKNAGYQVFEARNAAQVLEVLSNVTPDLILMDVSMPGMDGLTLTRQLKADEKTRSICVVAWTAYASKEDKKRCWKRGAMVTSANPSTRANCPHRWLILSNVNAGAKLSQLC